MTALRFAHTAALMAALVGGGAALAQTTAPTPKVVTDVAPLPAEDRSSLGAVVFADSPVLAKREMMENLAATGVNTSVMGAGPAPARELDKASAKRKAQTPRRLPPPVLNPN